ncbi:hypothetical protein BGZ54_000702 [Gamsiella multidivaricata]|nr:hypothetical protein BGZ54_000702 [Gamsiella multidivaricata]
MSLSLQHTTYLEHYMQTQEAAKCFEDDLDFCPSLTASELSERASEYASAHARRREARWSQLDHSSPLASPRTPSQCTVSGRFPPTSKAIAIVDPASKAPVQLPPPGFPSSKACSTSPSIITPSRHGSISSVSSVSSGGDTMSHIDAQDTSLLDWTMQQQQQDQQMLQMQQLQFLQQQQQHHHQPFACDMMFAPSAAAQGPFFGQDMSSRGMFYPSNNGVYSPPSRATSRIPIVNPNNGSTVSLSEAPVAPMPAMPAWHHPQYFVSVR